MFALQRFTIRFSLVLLLVTLIAGLLAACAYLFPNLFNHFLPFQLLRPVHTSAALFWIIGAAACCVSYLQYESNPSLNEKKGWNKAFMYLWVFTIIAVFIHYGLNQFGGREYWEFPPYLNLPLLAAWIFLIYSLFTPLNKSTPAYEWMWMTGLLFFLFTFLEQNAWQIPWFRESFRREITVQWKANGSMVGAWNQMIYGLSFFMMYKISGDRKMLHSRQTYFFYFLGLFNLMFNWGHHIYNLPNTNWMRHVAYAVSMTEWLFLLKIIRDFRKTLDTAKKLRHLVSYRFLTAAEFWVAANLILALLMSIPAFNRYSHGTHITVAHAMGTTIGINTFILLGAISYILRADLQQLKYKRIINITHKANQYFLGIFWVALIIAGWVKGYLTIEQPKMHYTQLMESVTPYIELFTFAGVGLMIGLGVIAIILLLMPFPQKQLNLRMN